MSGPVAVKPHIPGMETYREKATRKFKENPWVPLGSMATVGALIVAMVKMRRGQSHSFNRWLRVRVAAQGLTLVAIVVGTYSLRPKNDLRTDDPTLTGNDADVERRRLEKLAKEHDEFEERLKGAQEAHVLESELKSGRRGWQPTKPGSASEVRDSAPSSSNAGGSWLGWFGWGRNSTTSEGPSGTPANASSQAPPSTTQGVDSTTKS
ncbi:hypothetical protein D9615_003361 [Tricholomella constricta]|uniref:HIG1 domain-containing protein n=1 Tax=Tricholomella constricta TaxID=117010 RepID=A0A8H5HIV5_9AGAR|nr:hypothetical protein D9615_003361 [Tricholomella constricta]